MKCECGFENEPGSMFCTSCGKSITPPPQMHPMPQTQQGQQGQRAQPPVYPPAYPPYPPYAYPPHPPYPPGAPKNKPFTLTDVFVIVAFVLAICGIFTYAYILLTASIICSTVAWRRKTSRRTSGLAVAALIVGICAAVIKIGSALEKLGLIPDWLSSGIF